MSGLLLAAVACVHPPPGESELGDRPVGTTTPITVDEIVNTGLLGATAFDVIQRLRPSFLIDRTAIRRSTQPISVSVNGGQPVATAILQSTPASTVQEIRYLTTAQAATRFGQRAEGPVIVVMLRRQQEP